MTIIKIISIITFITSSLISDIKVVNNSISKSSLIKTLKGEKNLKCNLTKVKNSCRIVYMNVVMTDFGKQRVRMVSCNEKK